jgi:23S rRNA (uracil1939-C5)-methyltransferase
MPEPVKVTIERLGHDGDGVAQVDGAPVFVPFTVPGDRVRIARDGARGEVLERLADGPARAEPACAHFSVCGGCKLQHLSQEAYAAFKRAQVEGTLAQRGIKGAEIGPLVALAPGTRRRAALSFRRTQEGTVLGFHKARRHDLVDLKECPVLLPAIVARLSDLRGFLAETFAPGAQGMLAVLNSEAGLDVALTLARAPEDARRLRLSLAEGARKLDLARIALDGEVIVERRPPVLHVAGIPLAPPPGAFVQASADAERVLIQHVLEGVGAARKVADLFAGLGTFSLALAQRAAVHAVDGNEALLAALVKAARHSRGLKPLTVERRDLFRAPLDAEALSRFEAVVFDPPRAGARAQCERLAASTVARVIAVSCNPASFARDARILLDGGFGLDWVRPVDQFLWSAEIELVAQFSRKGR